MGVPRLIANVDAERGFEESEADDMVQVLLRTLTAGSALGREHCSGAA